MPVLTLISNASAHHNLYQAGGRMINNLLIINFAWPITLLSLGLTILWWLSFRAHICYRGVQADVKCLNCGNIAVDGWFLILDLRLVSKTSSFKSTPTCSITHSVIIDQYSPLSDKARDVFNIRAYFCTDSILILIHRECPYFRMSFTEELMMLSYFLTHHGFCKLLT